jgi:hypothetical protein
MTTVGKKPFFCPTIWENPPKIGKISKNPLMLSKPRKFVTTVGKNIF